MSFVTSTVQDIDNRLAELQTEVSRLTEARDILAGPSESAPARPGPPPQKNGNKGKPRRPGRPAGSKVNRADQALSIVQANPGIKIPALAEQMSIEPNYLYRVMPKLAKDGSVAKAEDGGWVPVGS